jgi:hypothetical protein
MRCAVLNCKENENGYCTCSSYVEIDETGSCTEMFILTKENTDDNEINV